ncbi:unnamed protein product [Medioppia subpectinata]|uniref:MD-2-related lipid-recognition domain-containing protein n=1 Tax=Medioppia subpectinata TaxID=1979941 RepID=A0A7R9L098_9ACAR|nr:unnamed protein product [Medioppia subpectinata]CAG2113082.1 unnamed protein product [Medioppia subpectinata]
MLKLVYLTLIISAVSANIDFKDCGNSEMIKIEINGCSGSPCVIHKGVETLFTFTYKANQASVKAIWNLHAIVGGQDIDMATMVPGFDPNGCHTTPCPIAKGEVKKLVYKSTIPEYVPNVDTLFKPRLIGDNGDLFCATFEAILKA